MNNYTVLHLHSMMSNGTTNIDSITKFEDYISLAKSYDMKSIAFSEHGNLFEWVKKKIACDKEGIKYIHAVECYITESLNEKIRDNFHTCLYARNWQGIMELNKLVSVSHNRNDGHFYYVPRITIDEFLNISNNILVTSACLGGVLANGNDVIKEKYLKYFIKNKNRCFLEIQHHQVLQQISYNQTLYKLHKEFNIPLIIGTDTHALNEIHMKGRSILQKSKGIHFDNEDCWDLTFKSYTELIECYKKQNSLPMNIVLEAIENTNVLANQIESFELDRKNKYPRLWNNPKEVFKQKIMEGYKIRNIDKKENKKIYNDRIVEEFKVYDKVDSIDYMLFMKDVVDYAHSNNMQQGEGRGSVTGSLIAYLLQITNMDSIKYDLNFFRFMNPSRISLCDIDTDWSTEDRDKIKKYLFNYKGIYASDIITFNTIALKGAIKDVSRALEIPLTTADEITKNIDDKNIDSYKTKYPELFEYVDLLQGVVVSVGTHPSGVLISPLPIDEYMGSCTIKGCENPVSMLNMKELDYLNYVKFDILGLDNVDIINRTCDLAKIERLSPDNLNLNDEKVWESIKDNTVSIFQWESDSAQDFIKKLFSNETINKIKKINPNISYLDLFSFGNGAIRPSGSSFREDASKGLFKDNGLKELNDFLSSTMGYCCYQETIMMFLVNFCGYSMSESDSVRRAIGKKLGTEDLLPEIERRFINTVYEKYNVSKERAIEIVKPFIQVILDASSYGFSLNHSQPYSIIGYECGWLRYYYPLEFITSALNVYKDKMDKIVRITEYAKQKNIKILPPQFRYSKSDYMYNKESNAIYKGISSIKFLNNDVANELYKLKNNQYNSFIELLQEISTNESINLNSKQIRILISLNYFSEFGKNQKLLNLVDLFDNLASRKQINHKQILELKLDENLIKKYCGKTTEKLFKDLDTLGYINEYEKNIPNKSMNIKEQIKAEIEYLGYEITTTDKLPSNVYIITNIDDKYTPKLRAYNLKTGNVENWKCKKTDIKKNPFGQFSIIKIKKIAERNKNKKINDEWVKTDEKETYLTEWEIIN